MAKVDQAFKAKPEYADFEPPPPDDFDDRTRPDINGWYSPENGGAILGVIVGVIMIEGELGPRRCACIKLESMAKANLAKRDGGSVITLKPGQVIGVSERSDIAELFDYDNGTRVWFRPIDKRSISGSRTLWKFAFKVAPGAKKVVQQKSEAPF